MPIARHVDNNPIAFRHRKWYHHKRFDTARWLFITSHGRRIFAAIDCFRVNEVVSNHDAYKSSDHVENGKFENDAIDSGINHGAQRPSVTIAALVILVI